MDEDDFPTTPFTLSEQHQIMNDLEQSKYSAEELGDEAKSYYLSEII